LRMYEIVYDDGRWSEEFPPLEVTYRNTKSLVLNDITQAATVMKKVLEQFLQTTVPLTSRGLTEVASVVKRALASQLGKKVQRHCVKWEI
jgi:hypothetical protein